MYPHSAPHVNHTTLNEPAWLTVVTNTRGPLSKKFDLIGGKLSKTPAAELTDGAAEPASIRTLDDLQKIIEQLAPDQALMFGVPTVPPQGGSVRIVTKQNLTSGMHPDAIARDRDHFGWADSPGVLMLDIDKPKEPNIKPLNSREVDSLLCNILPWWRDVGRMYRPSVSAGIKALNGQALTGAGSLRCYALVNNAADIPFVGVAIADAVWKAGHGRIEFSAAGSMLVRGLVDTAVWSPERLDFAGPAILGPGLTRDSHPPKIISGGVIDTEAAIASGPGRFTLTQWQSQSKEVRAAKAAHRPEETKRRKQCVAKRVADDVKKGKSEAESSAYWTRAVENQELYGDFVIFLRDGKKISVRELLDNRDKYNEARCCDPLDPAYTNDNRIAHINLKPEDGKPYIYSHAHGGVRYALLHDAPQAAPAEDVWGEPQPIEAPLRSVPRFDAEALLPDAFRAWVMDGAERMPCSPEYVAVGALVTAGSLIGARCAIKPKARDDWEVIPNLWGGIVGLPSAKKSPGIGVALGPLHRLEQRAREQYEKDIKAFDVNKIVFEAQRDAILGDIKSAAKTAKDKSSTPKSMETLKAEYQQHLTEGKEAPTERRYKTNDATVEKLGELLQDNPAGLLVTRDELAGLLVSWDKEGHEGDRSFFLEAWNGNSSFDTDRIGRGSIHIPNLCVSVFGGIQPDKLTRYLEQTANAMANDGMLQRFQMLVYPDHTPWAYRDYETNVEAKDRAYGVFDKLADLVPIEYGAIIDAKLPSFRFSDEAQHVFIEWTTDLHGRLDHEENPLVAQHLAKYDKLYAALALILHLIDVADGARPGPVTRSAALRAAAWCEFLEAHARRCYGLLQDDGLRAAQALASKVRQGVLRSGFTAREVRRGQWRYLTKDTAITAAIEWLEDANWIRSEQSASGARGGRPTSRYLVNPAVASASQPIEAEHIEGAEDVEVA